MERRRQQLSDILSRLSPIETGWKDELAESVIGLLTDLPEQPTYEAADVARLLEADFSAGLTTARLFLNRSKDEFERSFRRALGPGGIGITRFRKDRHAFLAGLVDLGLTERMTAVVHRPTTWRDVLIERLKSGRGSAIKGQRRGRSLEDFAEEIVIRVFNEGRYDLRCRFVGESGQSTEKTDFAIPTRENPRILLEAKAYGATGSKQTDILGDITRMVEQKRHDTTLLLLLDGESWRERKNDLRKLLELQNRGRIARIYTMRMAEELEEDLRLLKAEHGL